MQARPVRVLKVVIPYLHDKSYPAGIKRPADVSPCKLCAHACAAMAHLSKSQCKGDMPFLRVHELVMSRSRNTGTEHMECKLAHDFCQTAHCKGSYMRTSD